MPQPDVALRRQPLNSVSTKIISFVFLSTFLTALVVSWISVHSTHGHLRRQIDARFPGMLHHAEEGMSEWLEEGQSELVRHAGDPDSSRWIASSRSLSGAVRFGRDGAPEATWGRETALLQSLGRRAVELESPALALIPIDRERAAVVAIAPTPTGGAAALFAREGLSRLLRFTAVETAGSLHMVDAEGRTLATASPNGPMAPLRARLKDLGSREPGVVHEYTSGNGEHVLGSVLPFAPLGTHLVVEEPFESAFAPVLEVVTRIFLSDLCIILVFSFLAYRITSSIMQPIEALSEGARRISQGQIDHEIPDPRSRDEIGLLTRTFNNMMRELRRNHLEIEEANTRLTEQYDELVAANEVLAQLSITDGLTKLHNHRYFQDQLTREIKRVGRSGEPLSILLMDLDDFKQFNDRMGHAAGDELLIKIAGVMSASIRESDVLARYGGEEFVVLAPQTDLAGAVALAEKIRLAVHETALILEDPPQPLRVTLSTGVARYRGDRKRFFAEADRALYRAKAEGKNCVIAAE